ncbi:CHAD domain-containing protein [Xinfangfangia sp. D13-10-4-6]|uniref:CHAD domain-containing protein n=1 Tax=Pseudogemmobacter hezensis TaxID=2737662 RepID=UPI001554E920|nr:CHAD domain-containing protein [Pseudogemmobacter hezensis]NPD17133.1 CHAD domain-containing protein [Pseudogemmobacter hezensis]
MTDRATTTPLTADSSCEQAFCHIIISCCQAIDRQLTVFLETENESGPHKARVALRRLTTALDAFSPILHRKQAAQVRVAAKRLFRTLGEIRDADVFLASQRGEKKALGDKVLALRRKTRKALRDSKAVGFAPGVLKLCRSGQIFRSDRRSQILRAAPVAVLARLVLQEAWADAHRYGPDPGQMGEEARHDFRKDLKTLRYLAEFFAGFWPGPAHQDFRSRMQGLQDGLGVLNDMANARQRGRAGDPDAEADALRKAARIWAAISEEAPFWAPPEQPATGEAPPADKDGAD